MIKNFTIAFFLLSLLTAACIDAADTAPPTARLAADKEILIWGDKIPGPVIEGIVEKYEDGRVTGVSVPRLEMFIPLAEIRTKTAVIVCPGGGYSVLAVDKEGYSTAKWLNSLGVTVFMLKYRLKEYGYPWPLCDLQQAIRVVRQRADEFGIDPGKIGVAGFSAGGHLASSGSVQWRHDFLKDAPAQDNLRPDFSILIYPVISLQPHLTHNGSKSNMLRDQPIDKIVDLLSNELHIDALAPPAFLLHATDDKAVQVENSILYYKALVKAGVSAEMHIFAQGGHGFGLAESDETLSVWPKLCENWLRKNGFVK